MTKTILIVQLLLFTLICKGQDSLNYRNKIQWKTMASYNIPINKMAKGAITDPFISYADHSITWQLFSFTYFFCKHWGVEANIQLGGSTNKLYDPNNDLQNDLSPKFPNHYVTVPYTYWDINSNPPLSEFTRANLGILYRFEKNRFVFYPKIAVGLTSFSTYSAEAYLKQKNANDVFRVTYLSKGTFAQNNFTISASSTFGYRLSKKLILFIDVSTSIFKPQLYYSATMTNLNTGVSTIEKYDYEKNVSNLSLGTGLIIEFPRFNYTLKKFVITKIKD